MKNCDSKYCECLYFTSNALARVMTKIADEEFSVIGLASTHAFLLMIVNEKPGIQPKEISEKLQLAQSTVTRHIEKMVYRNFLVRDQIGKYTKIFPKQASIDLDEQIRQAWRKLHRRYSTILGKKEGETLISNNFNASQALG